MGGKAGADGKPPGCQDRRGMNGGKGIAYYYVRRICHVLWRRCGGLKQDGKLQIGAPSPDASEERNLKERAY